MGICDKSANCTLIDATYSICGLHIGVQNHWVRDSRVSKEDYEWNLRLLGKCKLWSSLYGPQRLILLREGSAYSLVKRSEYKHSLPN